jgi:hypothetical protein
LKTFVKQEISGTKTILSVSNLILIVVNLLCPSPMDIYVNALFEFILEIGK